MRGQTKTAKIVSYLLFAITFCGLVVCSVLGQSLSSQGNIVWTNYTISIMFCSALLGAVMGVICCGAIARLGFYGQKKIKEKKSVRGLYGVSPRLFFGGSLLLILLGWLPAFFAYYPAICAYDMPIQTGQILEGVYIDHHPLVHTALLKLFMGLGENVFGEINTGIAMMALVQLVLLAASFAYGVTVIYQENGGFILLNLLQILCMLYPLNWYMSVSLTKDTFFTAFFVFGMLFFSQLLQEENRERKWKYGAGFGISIVGMMLFRNNGKYALLVLIVALLLAWCLDRKNKKRWRNLFLYSCACFGIGLLALTLLFHGLHASQGDRREMLSMPIQQLSRVMLYHGGIGVLPEDDGTLTETEKALIDDFLLNQGYLSYDPHISDPVKRNANTYVVRYRTKEFVTTYFSLFLRYPGDFINAAYEVNAGYLYPDDTSHAQINVTGDDRIGRGYIQTYWEEDTLSERGIFKDSKWQWMQKELEFFADRNAYLNMGIMKYLFVPGVWIWAYLFLVCVLFQRGRLRACMPVVLVFGYFLTLLLGPTVQLRYIYPIMAAYPFELSLAIIEEKRCPDRKVAEVSWDQGL